VHETNVKSRENQQELGGTYQMWASHRPVRL
jgi:hypothetical protein